MMYELTHGSLLSCSLYFLFEISYFNFVWSLSQTQCCYTRKLPEKKKRFFFGLSALIRAFWARIDSWFGLKLEAYLSFSQKVFWEFVHFSLNTVPTTSQSEKKIGVWCFSAIFDYLKNFARVEVWYQAQEKLEKQSIFLLSKKINSEFLLLLKTIIPNENMYFDHFNQ